MKIAYFTLAILLLLGGCSGQEQFKAKASKGVVPVVASAKNSQAQAYSGNYYHGDGLGHNISLKLKTDGTYSGEWRGCLGVYGTAKGKWSVQGQQIILKPLEETDMMKGHLRSLDIIRYEKKTMFVPTADRKDLLKRLPKYSQFGALSRLCFVKK